MAISRIPTFGAFADHINRKSDEADDILRPTSPPEDREVTCGACGQPGVLEEFNPRTGFLISHPGRTVACRAPLEPTHVDGGVVDGDVVEFPVEISDN